MMTDSTETMNTETTIEKTSEVKTEPMATDEANTDTAPAGTATEGDKGEDKKPAENGTAESTTDSADSPPKLFVGRLPLGTKDTQLKELFGTYGEVTHCDIVGKYGFVHMKNKSEADEAMKNLNNHPFNGANITVQMSTSTAKKPKKKPNRKNFDNNKKNINNANTSTNSNQATTNRRQNVKNGFQQKNKNGNGNNNNNNSNNNNKSSTNNNNANNRNKNGNVNNNNNNNNNNNLGHNNRQNGVMNKMRGRKFPTHRMHPMMPQLAPMNQGGYYQNNQPPMNPQPYYQPPMPQHQMQPVGGPRDMYNNYNSRPMDNGQYYRSNGQSPQPMYGGGVGGSGIPPQVPPQQSYYPPVNMYSNRAPVGGMGKMNPMPTHQQPQPPMYGSPMNMGPMGAAPASMSTGGYGQMNSGYGNSPIMGSNGVNNFTTRNGYAKGRGNNTRFNNYTPNQNRPNKRAKLN